MPCCGRFFYPTLSPAFSPFYSQSFFLPVSQQKDWLPDVDWRTVAIFVVAAAAFSRQSFHLFSEFDWIVFQSSRKFLTFADDAIFATREKKYQTQQKIGALPR